MPNLSACVVNEVCVCVCVCVLKVKMILWLPRSLRNFEDQIQKPDYKGHILYNILS